MHQVSLVRIIGNDVPEIHSNSQSLENLEYILKNEKNFLNCKKIFILNRIINKKIENKIVNKLKKYNFDYFIIPFNADEFINFFNQESSPFENKTDILSFDQKKADFFTTKMPRSIYYLTNVNVARNFGLKKGSLYSTTTLIFDGSCFITEELYRDFLDKLEKTKQNDKTIFIFPMHRLSTYEQIKKNDEHNFWFEPQIGIKNGNFKFDENSRWPEDKIEFLYRHRIKGYWDIWMQETQKYEESIFDKVYCNGVFRLPSGTPFDFKHYKSLPDVEVLNIWGTAPQKNTLRKAGLVKLLQQAYSLCAIDKNM
jgi:hypothetical protein